MGQASRPAWHAHLPSVPSRPSLLPYRSLILHRTPNRKRLPIMQQQQGPQGPQPPQRPNIQYQQPGAAGGPGGGGGQAQNMLAQAWQMHRAGRFQQAEQMYKQMLKMQPNNPTIMRMLGMLKRQTGRIDEAIKLLQNAVRIMPNDLGCQGELGVALLMAGRIGESVQCSHKVLELDPKSADAMYHLGRAHGAMYDFETAIYWTRQALTIKPGNVEYHAFLGYLYLRQGLLEQSVKHTRGVLQVQPQNPAMLCQLATALRRMDEYDEAMELFEKALSIDATNTEAMAGKAQILESQGKTDEALALIEQCAASEKGEQVQVAVAYERIAKRAGCPDRPTALIRKMLTRDNLQPIEQIILHFRLGALLEDAGEFDDAFEQYRLANDMHPQPFDPDAFTKQIDTTITVFDSKRLAAEAPRSTVDSDLPIFIVGMPRSGTSLTEQILASHPQVFGAGELPHMERMVAAVARLGGADSDTSYFDGVNSVTAEQLTELAEKHIEALTQMAGETEGPLTRVTDKMPNNFLHLGLIALLFPNAHIIHCVRNPLDTCMSCYGSQLPPVHTFSNSLDGLAVYYKQYRRMMDHWKAVLPIPIMDVVYEDLVNDQERVSRELVEFAGLEWDDACLNFHESKRVVHTLSMDQVRKPMYKSAMNRHERFAQQLEPLKTQLAAFV